MGASVTGSTETRIDGAAQSLERAHAALLRDKRLQFDFLDYKPPKVPDWLKHLGELLQGVGKLAPVLNWVFWILVALVVGLILYFLIREIGFARFGWKRRKPARSLLPTVDWRPDAARARVLLEDADRLAAEGRYAEAAHLILLRGVDDIQDRRPQAVRPALTSREIAASPDLPAPARPAFAAIAEVVERALFGGRPVDEGDWTQCRQAYQSLVFPETWA